MQWNLRICDGSSLNTGSSSVSSRAMLPRKWSLASLIHSILESLVADMQPQDVHMKRSPPH